ncbi:MAG: efflux transporter periplasmic adaptor subunit, partial [Planctomycetes bacterium]|nr:efflux transporter periplasmic adaptor subunit [Planctomycetota bacterium]
MKTFLLHVLLPLLVLAGAGGVAWWLVATKKPAPAQVPVVQAPLVRTVVAVPESLQLVVASQGTAAARTQTTLAAEVGGRVLAVAPELRDGAFFAAGAELVRIDPVEHAAAVAQAKAVHARAERVLAWERAAAAAAVAVWQRMNGGTPPALVA